MFYPVASSWLMLLPLIQITENNRCVDKHSFGANFSTNSIIFVASAIVVATSARLAQSVERWTLNPTVVGSSPTLGSNFCPSANLVLAICVFKLVQGL